MRKSLSSLVVVAMLLMVVAPLLALAPQTLPACCRAGGKHHCVAMMNMGGGQGFQAQAPPCPYRHGPAVAPAPSALGGAPHTLAIAASCSELYIPAIRTVTLSSSYSVPKRGPPPLA
jgi:hypothetical protein